MGNKWACRVQEKRGIADGCFLLGFTGHFYYSDETRGPRRASCRREEGERREVEGVCGESRGDGAPAEGAFAPPHNSSSTG